MNDLLTSYEEAPYPDLSYTQTHPDRLATIATLLGMEPAPVTGCRVLELGCAGGGNLIPMAATLPESEFVGLDFAQRQITAGQELVSALALENLELRVHDLLDPLADLGLFDYIIAHGVYSWVPEEVADRLLQICRDHLAPQGIAYVSYNVYPGWHLLQALRQMMLYHIKTAGLAGADPATRVAGARDLLRFLAEATPDSEAAHGSFMGAYSSLLDGYLRLVDRQRQATSGGDLLLLHDELEVVNRPLYFHEFADHAAQHGLQYLAEANFSRVMPNEFSLEVKQQLMRVARDMVSLEQYMDFLRNRTLRQTLLCHEEVEIDRVLRSDPERMAAFQVASRARPIANDKGEGPILRLQGGDGATFATDHPVTKAALLHLARHSPLPIPFETLVATAQGEVYGRDQPSPEAQEKDARLLAANLLQAFGYSLQLLELHVHVPPFVVSVSDHPVAAPLARFQAARGLALVNRRHERVSLDRTSRELLPYIDGTRGPAELLEVLNGLVAAGKVPLPEEGDRETAGGDVPYLAGELRQVMGWLARAALLIG